MKLVGLWAIGFLASLLQTLSDRFAVTSEESESSWADAPGFRV